MATTTLQQQSTALHIPSSVKHSSLMAVGSNQQNDSKPHDVYADFYYYLDPGDGSLPEPINVTKPGSHLDKPKDTRTVLVHDLRGQEENFSLDKNGFQIYRHVSQEKDFLETESIEAHYLPEIERFVKEVTGASKVLAYNYTVRREPDNTKATSYVGRAGNSVKNVQGPVRRVHVDQTYLSAPWDVYRHLPQEAEQLLSGRYQIINVWRPIKPIYKDPLAVADARTVPDEDLVPVKLIYPNREGATFTVKPGAERGRETHQWYYLYGQQPSEVIMFKCYDSKKDGRARAVPHCAFTNQQEEHREARESIEVRCMVFHPKESE